MSGLRLRCPSGRGTRRPRRRPAAARPRPAPSHAQAQGTPDALPVTGAAARRPQAPAPSARGPTVGVVLLAQRLRGGLAVAVLLAPVVLLLAQVLLRRAWGRAAGSGRYHGTSHPRESILGGPRGMGHPPCHPGDAGHCPHARPPVPRIPSHKHRLRPHPHGRLQEDAGFRGPRGSNPQRPHVTPRPGPTRPRVARTLLRGPVGRQGPRPHHAAPLPALAHHGEGLALVVLAAALRRGVVGRGRLLVHHGHWAT